MNETEILEKARACDVMISIFTLVLGGGESNRQAAAEKIGLLSPEARRDLRAALQDLDNLVDDVWLEELREKRRLRRRSSEGE
jgi:hypothetical protein